MQVHILNQTLEFENKEEQIGYLFQKVNQVLIDSSHVLNYIKVDGIEVYGEYESYITEKINDIQVIEVVASTFKQLMNETLISADEYLSRLFLQVESLADEFYKGPNAESWKRFADLMEGIQWLNHMIGTIDQKDRSYLNWDQYIVIQATMQNVLRELEDAFNQGDTVFIGDIINHELCPLLYNLQKEIKITLDNEVVRDDLN